MTLTLKFENEICCVFITRSVIEIYEYCYFFNKVNKSEIK